MNPSPSVPAPKPMRRHSRRRRTFTIFSIVAFLATLLVVSSSLGTAAAAPGPAPVMTGYVPLPADEFHDALLTAGPTINATIRYTIGITVAADGARVYYDHWEDGYEAAINDPAPPTPPALVSTTLTFGDGDITNGNASTYCGTTCTGDTLSAGTVLKFQNDVPTPRSSATQLFDGRDKIASTRGFSLVAGGYPSTTGSVIAGVVSSYDTSKYGLDYVAPVGENTYENLVAVSSANMLGTNDSMRASALIVQASQDDTLVRIDKDANGTFDQTDTIDEGEVVIANGGVQEGAHVVADKPVQVHQMAGDPTLTGGQFESRWFTLFPTALLTADYLSPQGTSSPTNQRTILYVHNPNGASITVTPSCTGCSGTLTVPAHTTRSFATPAGQAVRLQNLATPNPLPFIAIGATGAQSGAAGAGGGSDQSAYYDSGYTLVPTGLLTTQAVLSWAPGNSSLTPGSASAGSGDPDANAKSDNPVWITTLTATTIYVDFNGNPADGTIDGTGSCTGQKWDRTISVAALASTPIWDNFTGGTGDGDMTGARIATCDGTKLAGAWAENPATASNVAPGFDAGYTIIPTTTMVVEKSAVSIVDSNGDGKVGPGDTLQYDVAISDAGALAFNNVVVKDGIPAGTSYVEDSTTFVGSGAPIDIDDDTSGTAFPLDGAGVGIPGGVISAGATVHVQYQLTIDNPMTVAQTSVTNTVDVTSNEASASDKLVTPLAVSDLSLTKTLQTTPPVYLGHNATYRVTVTNAGPDAVRGVEVTDQIPAGTTFVSSTAGSDYNSTTGVWAVGDLAASGAGATKSFDITVTVNTTSAVTNVAEVTRSGSSDPDSQPDENDLGPSNSPDQDDEASVTTTPSPEADLSLAKTVQSGPDGSGNVTFRLTLTNGGPSVATGVTVQDYPPAGSTYVAPHTASTGTFNSGTNVWSIPSLANGASATLDVTYHITTFPSTNYAQVTAANEHDPDSQPTTDTLSSGNPNNEDDESAAALSGQPDISLTKSASSISYAGGAVTYTVTVSNAGAVAATGVVVTDVLPNGVTFTGSTTTQGTYSSSTGLWNVGTVNAGGSQTLTLTGVPTAPGTYVNNAEVTAQDQTDADSTPNNHNAAEDDQASASITVAGTDIGDRVWYDVDGDGVQDAGEPGIPGVTVTYTWAGPDGTFSTLDDVTSFTGTGANGAWLVQDLPSGPYRVDVSTLPKGLTAQTYDLDGLGTGGSATFSVVGGTDRSDVDFGYRGTVTVGDTVFHDTTKNDTVDLGEGLDGVTVHATWSGFDDTFGTADDLDYPTATTAGGGLYSFANLPTGAVRISVDTPPTPTGLIPSFDADGSNDRTSTVTLVTGPPVLTQDFGFVTSQVDLSITKSDGGASVAPGGTVAYTLSYGNSASATAAATGVTLTETVPANSTFNAGASTAGWSCTPNNNAGATCTLAVGSVAIGGSGSATFAVTVTSTVPAGVTQISNTASITDDTTHGSDTDPSNNTSSDTTPVSAAPDLTITKTDGDASVSPGGVVTYSLGYANSGNRGATNVVLTETVPANSNFVAASSTAGWSCTPSNGPGSTCTLTIGALAAGSSGSATFAVRADYPLAGGVTQLTNTANIADDGTNGTDPTPANNEDDDSTPVEAGTLGDRVFLDVNGNSSYDAGEGLAGVGVQVIWAGPDDTLGNGDDVLATVNTDSTGLWTATGLPAGAFRVAVVTAGLPAGVANTVDPDSGNDSTATTTLTAGETDDTQDFGYRGTGSIGDVVWRDVDGDGVQDGGEPGLGGVGLTAVWAGPDADIATTGDNQSWTTTTNGSGAYTFANLPAGTYTVTITGGTPPGSAQTYDVDGTGTTNTATVVLAAGANDTTVDFGYRSGGVVGDTVFLDLDGNGTQDVGDTGVSGVTVTLYGDYDQNPSTFETLIGTTTTNGSGYYTFTGVDAVPVRATVTTPSGYGSSTPTDVDHAMGTNEVFEAADFGVLPGSIAGTTWFDDDDDGVFGVGDTVIPGVTVTLLGGSNNVVATTTTDGSGNYRFRGLVAGSYTVVFTAPDGQVFTIQDACCDDTVDSDPSPGAGSTGTVIVAAGASVTDVDAGLYDVGSLSGTVYRDLDNDAAQDSGETGVDAATITLTGTDDRGTSVNRTTATDANGNYTFEDLRAGTYTITETQPAGLLDGKDTVGTLNGTGGNDVISNIDVTPGDDGTGYLFGEIPATSLAGTVYEDLDGDGILDGGEPGIVGVTVELSGTDDLGGSVTLSTTTGAFGVWTFANLRPGTYAVAETTPAGYTDGKDAAGTAAGTVGANDGVGSDSITTIVLSAGTTASEYTFGEVRPGSIGDRVWDDADADGTQDGDGIQPGTEPGLVGVSVTLSGTDFAGNPVTASTTTGSNGSYVFTNLLPGTYTVTAGASGLPLGYLASPPASDVRTGIALPSNAELDTADFGFRPPSGTIGDTVFSDIDGDGVQDAGEPGLGSVLVAITGANLPPSNPTSALTSGSGTYQFTTLPPGTYTVTVTPPSGLDATTPTSFTFTIVQDETRDDADFGFTPPPAPPAGFIGDRVWNDADSDGVQDLGEVGVPGATVTLLIDADHDGSFETSGATQATGADGSYGFANLPPGSYEVVLTVPAGQHATTPSAIPVTLVSGQSVDQADFGVSATPAAPASIGDTVFDDADASGAQDGSETGLANVTVTLRQDTDGDGTFETVAATATTDVDGLYAFPGLEPGSYTVTVTPPSGYTPTNPSTLTVVVLAGTTFVDADFGLTTSTQVAPSSVDGTVWSDANSDGTYQSVNDEEKGVNGVTVTLLQDTDGDGVYETTIGSPATTAGNGGYAFTNLAPGRYRVVVTPPAGQSVTTAGSHDVVLVPGSAVHEQDFGLATPGSVPFDLQLTKTAQGEAVQGATIAWLLTATNNGINPTPNPITLTDVLPAGLTFVSASGTGWSCSAAGQTVTCTLAQSVAVGGSTSLTIVTTVGSDVPAGTQLTNNATVSANGVELTLTNNSDDAFAEVLAQEVEAPAPTPTPTPSTTPTPTPTSTTGSLPATGDNSARLALFGLVLLGAGATLLGLRRRQQR